MPCASAFLTSDCEIPNCLAIADGLTPALKAARTAFSLPVVNEPAPSWAASWRRCGFASATGFSFAELGGRRPRRSASVVTAASSASISTSSNRFSAPAKSFGKKWRCCEARLSGPALPFGTAESPAAVVVGRAENRSGVVSAGRRVGMPPTMPPVAHRGNSWQGYARINIAACAPWRWSRRATRPGSAVASYLAADPGSTGPSPGMLPSRNGAAAKSYARRRLWCHPPGTGRTAHRVRRRVFLISRPAHPGPPIHF